MHVLESLALTPVESLGKNWHDYKTLPLIVALYQQKTQILKQRWVEQFYSFWNSKPKVLLWISKIVKPERKKMYKEAYNL